MTTVFAFLSTFILAPLLLSYIPLMTIWDILGIRVRRELADQCPLFQVMHTLQMRRMLLLGRVARF